MSNLKKKFAFVYLLAIMIVLTYQFQIADLNDYLGYIKINVDLKYIVLSFGSLFFISLLFPVKIDRPSDFFKLFHIVFVLIPYSVLFSSKYDTGFSVYILGFVILLVPILLLNFLLKMRLKLPSFSLISENSIPRIISIICVFGVILAFSRPTSSAGFDFESVYTRRLEGRDIYISGSIIAYLNAMIANGFSPLLAFFSAVYRRPFYLLLSILSTLIFFYLLGVKAPILFLLLGWTLGYLCRRDLFRYFAYYLTGFIIIAMLASFIEFVFFDTMLVADIFIRRVFVVPPFLVATYLEFITTSSGYNWDLISGITSDTYITYLIGEYFLGKQGENANTNTYVLQFVSGGLPMYIVTLTINSVLFYILDSKYQQSQRFLFLFIGFIFALLTTEQAITTVLISSGVFFIFLLAIFSRQQSSVAIKIS